MMGPLVFLWPGQAAGPLLESRELRTEKEAKHKCFHDINTAADAARVANLIQKVAGQAGIKTDGQKR